MKHVLQRRFNKTVELSLENPENLPDLIVIDGGKNQLNIAEEVLNQLDLGKIPVISIAKGIKRNSVMRSFILEKVSLVSLKIALFFFSFKEFEMRRIGSQLVLTEKKIFLHK